LLQNGARTNAQTLDVFSTILREAARHGKGKIVRVFLENGADDTWAEGATPPLKTALEVAIEAGQLGVVEVFRERGAGAEVSLPFSFDKIPNHSMISALVCDMMLMLK